MTDETHDFWAALWLAGDAKEREVLRAIAERSGLLWWCVCGQHHDAGFSQCWSCGRPRGGQVRQSLKPEDLSWARFWQRMPE